MNAHTVEFNAAAALISPKNPAVFCSAEDHDDRAGARGMTYVLVGLFLYFLPFLNALFQRRTNTSAIFLLNLFLGWTFIGWVVALVWSQKKA